MLRQSYDLIVVGSGPGGATVARQAAGAGMSVLLLERGGDETATGSGSMLATRAMLARTRFHALGGRASLVKGVGLGGSTMLYFASAWTPPFEMFARHGVNLGEAVQVAKGLVPNAILPDRIVGEGARRIADAAQALGYPWCKLPKLIDTRGNEHPRFDAKWNARAFVTEAVVAGAQVLTGATVLEVTHETGRVVGVRYRRLGQVEHVRAERVVLAAGGLATPKILHASGVKEVGTGFFCDPIMPLFGYHPGLRLHDEYAMCSGWLNHEAGYMLSDMSLTPMLFAGFTALSGKFHRLLSHKRTLVMMVKIRDGIGGSLSKQGSPRKRFLIEDLEKLEAGCAAARRILIHAGARDIYRGPITSAHPGGTVRLGEHLDCDLQTRIENLHVCDCSVIPEPWGLPPTLTLVSLGIYLAKVLTRDRVVPLEKLSHVH